MKTLSAGVHFTASFPASVCSHCSCSDLAQRFKALVVERDGVQFHHQIEQTNSIMCFVAEIARGTLFEFVFISSCLHNLGKAIFYCLCQAGFE